MATITPGTKTTTEQGNTITINVTKSIVNPVNGVESLIYKNVGGRGNPRQEMSMTRAVYDSQGWS